METARLKIKYLIESMQGEGRFNNSLILSEILGLRQVISVSVLTPPSNPSKGDAYIVPAGATGDWALHVNSIAYWFDERWLFIVPQTGFRIYDLNTGRYLLFDGSAWGTQLGNLFRKISFQMKDLVAVTGSPSLTTVSLTGRSVQGWSMPTGVDSGVSVAFPVPHNWHDSTSFFQQVKMQFLTPVNETSKTVAFKAIKGHESVGAEIATPTSEAAIFPPAVPELTNGFLQGVVTLNFTSDPWNESDIQCLEFQREGTDSFDTYGSTIYLIGAEVAYLTDDHAALPWP